MTKKKLRILEIILTILLIIVFILPHCKININDMDYSINYIARQYKTKETTIIIYETDIDQCIYYTPYTKELKFLGEWSDNTFEVAGTHKQRKLLVAYMVAFKDNKLPELGISSFRGTLLKASDGDKTTYKEIQHTLSEQLKSEGR